jgi:hypothetical protein
MASPTVRGRTAPAAGLSTTSPAGTAVGDMVIVFTFERAGAGIPDHTLQANFVEIVTVPHNDGSTDGRLSIAYKIATSSGAVAYQAYTSSVGTETWTGCEVITVGTFAATATNKGPTASAGLSQTTNAAPDPASVTLGVGRDWLVFVAAGWHHGSSASITPTAPTNYTDLIEVAGASTGDLGIAQRSLSAAASENPGVFGDNIAPNGTVSATIGIGSPIVFTRAATIDGTGAVASAATFFTVFERSTATDGVGAITVSGTVIPGLTEHERAAAIDAVGAIASSGIFFTVFERASAIDGVGAIASSGESFTLYERSAAFDAVGAITTDSEKELFRSAAIDGAGLIASDGHSILERSAGVNATGAITSSAEFLSIFERSISHSATATISTAGQTEQLRSVAIGATGSVASNGLFFSTLERSSAINAVAAIESDGEIALPGVPEHERAAAIDASGLIASQGSFYSILERSILLSTSATISTTHQRELIRAATLNGAGTITVTITPVLEAHVIAVVPPQRTYIVSVGPQIPYSVSPKITTVKA